MISKKIPSSNLDFSESFSEQEIPIFIRRHWMAIVSWLVFVVIMFSTPIVVLMAILYSGNWQLFLGESLIYLALGCSSLLLFAAAVFMVAWIEHYLEVSIITNDRLFTIRQIGLFNRRVAELSLLRVQDVSAQMNGYLQSLFQFGTVTVETAGEAPNFIMNFVPKPHLVANTILMLHDRLAHGDNSLSAASKVADGQSKSANTRDRVIHKLPNSAPPKDFDRRRLDSGMSRVENPKPSSKEEAIESILPPNRLPPKNRFKESRELEEGELISLQDL